MLKARYYPAGRLEDTVFSGNSSQTWQSIVHGLELLKKGLIWRIGDGASVRIWRDQWIPHPLARLPISPQGRCRLRRVSELLDDRGNWNVQLLNQHFMSVDVMEIMKIKVVLRLDRDIIAWAPEHSGSFTVRSAYHLSYDEIHRQTTVASSRAPDGRRAVWALIWRCPAPSKVHIFAWRLVTNSLATWVNKKSRKLEVSNLCPLCAMEPEDTFHTFCRCPLAVALWNAMQEKWLLPDLASMRNTCPEWLLYKLNEDDRMNVLMVLCRSWYVRNEIVHHKLPPPIEASCRFLISYAESLRCINHFPTTNIIKGKMVPPPIGYSSTMINTAMQHAATVQWSTPPAGRVKLNVDGSFVDTDGGLAGAGMILRDNDGNIIFSACRSILHCFGLLQAELLACQEGLSLALQWSTRPVDIEMDCMDAVKLIKSPTLDRSPHRMIVQDIKRLFGERDISIAHVSRNRNVVSHTLAAFGQSEGRAAVWLRSGPADVPLLCRNEYSNS